MSRSLPYSLQRRSRRGLDASALERICLQSESVRRPPEETAATAPPRRGYGVVGAGKLRDEFLDRETFYTLKEAQVLIEQWRKLYNEVRPHSALGYRLPAPEAI